MLGLLTLGSSYKPRLPAQLKKDSGFVRRSSPITAAGPYRNLTGLPFYGPEGPTFGCQTCLACLIEESLRLVNCKIYRIPPMAGPLKIPERNLF